MNKKKAFFENIYEMGKTIIKFIGKSIFAS